MDREWTLQDAKNKFSEVVERAQAGEPQVVTKRGKRAVVVVDAAAFEAMGGGTGRKERRPLPQKPGESPAALRTRLAREHPDALIRHLLGAPEALGGLRRPRKAKLRRLDFD